PHGLAPIGLAAQWTAYVRTKGEQRGFACEDESGVPSVLGQGPGRIQSARVVPDHHLERGLRRARGDVVEGSSRGDNVTRGGTGAKGGRGDTARTKQS